MKTAEEKAKKSIRKMVKYLLNVNNETVIEGYAATFDDIMESYASEVAREKEQKFRNFIRTYHLSRKWDKWSEEYDEWKPKEQKEYGT